MITKKSARRHPMIKVLVALRIFVPRRSAWAAGLLLTMGAVLRYRMVFMLHPPEQSLFSDMQGYFQSAQDIIKGHYHLNGIFQSVSFPLIISWSLKWFNGSLFFIKGLNFAASTATMVLAWRGSIPILGEKRGRWVLLLMTFHFPQIILAGFLLTETLFGLVIAYLYYCLATYPFPWKGRHGFKIGAVIALGMGLKGNNFFFIPIMMLWAIAWASREKKPVERFIDLMVPFWGGLVTVILVTGLYTQIFYGAFQVSATSGALNLVEGKCASKINTDVHGAIYHSPLFVQLNEHGSKFWPRPFNDQAFFLSEALKCIAEEPIHLLTSVRYAYFLFFDNVLWPGNMGDFRDLNRTYGRVFGALFWPGILIGLLMFTLCWRSTDYLPFLLVWSIIVCVVTFKGEMRFRVPFDSVFIPIGVLGWGRILSYLPGFPNARALKWEPRCYWLTFLALFLGVGGAFI